MFGDAPAASDLLPAELEVSEAITQIDGTRKEALAKAVRSAVKRLHGAGQYPASECVDGLIRVTVHATPRSSYNPVFDMESEARRIVRGLVRDGAAQIPANREGALLVHLGRCDQGHLGQTFDEVKRWILKEGSLEQQLKYVLLMRLAFYQHNPLLHVLPIGRRRLPSDIIQMSNALVRGANRNACLLNGYTDDDLPLLEPNGDWPGVEE